MPRPAFVTAQFRSAKTCWLRNVLKLPQVLRVAYAAHVKEVAVVIEKVPEAKLVILPGGLPIGQNNRRTIGPLLQREPVLGTKSPTPKSKCRRLTQEGMEFCRRHPYSNLTEPTDARRFDGAFVIAGFRRTRSTRGQHERRDH